MAKNRTKRAICEVVSPRPVEHSTLDLLGFLVDARQGLLATAMNAGLEVLRVMLENDRRRLCGPKGRPNPDREATRYGYDDGSVVLGGRRVAVRKPRVRTVSGEEVPLPTYERFNEEDPLSRRVLEQMVLGVSTRHYPRSLGSMEGVVSVTATGSSSVSRRFVARTQRQLETFMSRSLEDEDFPILLLDGTGFGEHTLVVAMGIDPTGRKHVLGVVEGSTENEAVCRRLLSNLVDRGLPVERARLVVSAPRQAGLGEGGDAEGLRQRAGPGEAAPAGAGPEPGSSRRSGGFDPGRARGDPHALEPRDHGGAGADVVHNQPHREPPGNAEAGQPQRDPLAEWRHGLALGRHGTARSPEVFQTFEGLPRAPRVAARSRRPHRLPRKSSNRRRGRRVECQQRSPSPINAKRDIA